jgi:hypothetical protein
MQRIENLLPLVGILSLVTALKKERPLLNWAQDSYINAFNTSDMDDEPARLRFDNVVNGWWAGLSFVQVGFVHILHSTVANRLATAV